MSAGKLRHRITILENSPQKSSKYGGKSDSWGAIDTVWGEFLFQRGREYLASDQVTNEAKATAKIRFRSDVGVDHRISFDDVGYDIVSTSNPDGRKRFLLLLLRRVE